MKFINTKRATTVWEIHPDESMWDEAEWCCGRYIRVRRRYFYFWGS
jgi:hypothetical protein